MLAKAIYRGSDWTPLLRGNELGLSTLKVVCFGLSLVTFQIS